MALAVLAYKTQAVIAVIAVILCGMELL
jgi:hypothetical protein